MWSETWQAYASLTYLEASSLSLEIETQLTYTAWALINFEYQLPLEVSDKMHSLFESKNWFIRVVHTLQLDVSFTSLPHTVVCHSCLFISTIVAYLYAWINAFWENFSLVLVYTTITHIFYKETPSQPFTRIVLSFTTLSANNFKIWNVQPRCSVNHIIVEPSETCHCNCKNTQVRAKLQHLSRNQK
jgi:hypothetical protein